jgi:DNA-binding NtrC family response regulator
VNKKAKILIVENEGIIARDIERILEKFGYNVLATVFSGEEALRKVEEYTPDLVITEIPLKGSLDGIDIAHRISSHFNIPVVFLTAVSDRKTIERAKVAEPYGFIIKPFEEEALHAAIEMALYKHRMQIYQAEKERTLPGSTKGAVARNTSQAGLGADWTRATFIVRKEHLEKIKALAYWERKKVKEVIDEALETYLKDKKIEVFKEVEKFQ